MRFFDKQKEEKTILDILTYDLTTFFYGKYKEVDSQDTEAMVMIVYERELPWVEYELFDTVQFRVFFDKKNFTGSNPINVKLYSKEQPIDIENIKKLVNTIAEVYKNDNHRKSFWTDEDEKEFNSGNWNRRWTIQEGESFITLYYEEGKFEMNILFLNNLIKHTGKYLNIKN